MYPHLNKSQPTEPKVIGKFQLFHLHYFLIELRFQLINKLYSKSVFVKYEFITKDIFWDEGDFP